MIKLNHLKNQKRYYPFKVKKKENEEALGYLKDRLDSLDKLNGSEKQKALILGVLAGNMFDWGAKEVVDLMEKTTFRFEDAQSKIPGK